MSIHKMQTILCTYTQHTICIGSSMVVHLLGILDLVSQTKVSQSEEACAVYLALVLSLITLA